MTVLVALSITFFSSTVYTLPAIDIGPLANPQIENTFTPAATLNGRGTKGYLTWESEVVAYENCCQYTDQEGETAFAINLAGVSCIIPDEILGGNNDPTPNVVETLTQDDCAPGLVKKIEENGGTIYAKTWTCVPSYGAPGDTLCFVLLEKRRLQYGSNGAYGAFS
ncbi:uncharacterized protein EAF02_011765 [Botrytis sinoallii]|uniref:uncharacterized protein n=1 Tax=Botrytis sinoallii TaxID=1463999 RepID=UPI0018FFE6BA|nr:uncharacterized protein EAF02_011765 [Botrytis sinoallii]KAF7854147.1 hypothetical protein EAF02_011765 [Botrytis sinoallii]